ncbi:MAG: HAD-IA family hydrolase [Clostridia bacterium]|nr:HAD-IA family hydrolase [Clostridia bacterium]
MKYDTYIFDLDGTLLDTLQDLAAAVNYAMRQKGYPVRTTDEVRGFIGNGIGKLIERSVPEGTDTENYLETLDIFRDYYLEHIADKTVPYDGIEETVAELKKRGCKIAVVSNKADEAARKVVFDYFGGDLFDMVLGKLDRFPSKPEPDSVIFVADSLGAQKSRCVYVGDSDVDIMTARNAGLPCIAVTWGNRDRASLEKLSPEFIAEKPSDILSLTE